MPTPLARWGHTAVLHSRPCESFGAADLFRMWGSVGSGTEGTRPPVHTLQCSPELGNHPLWSFRVLTEGCAVSTVSTAPEPLYTRSGAGVKGLLGPLSPHRSRLPAVLPRNPPSSSGAGGFLVFLGFSRSPRERHHKHVLASIAKNVHPMPQVGVSSAQCGGRSWDAR